MRISIIIPVHNEEAYIPLIVKELHPILEKYKSEGVEVLFADDASTDGTAASIRKIEDPRYRLVQLPRKTGKCLAIFAGIQEAQGEYLVTMDADLQVRPSEIPGLIEALRNPKIGCAIASRRKRNDGWIKLATSVIGNFFNQMTFGLKVRDANSCLRAFQKKAVQNIIYFRHFHRFLVPLIIYQGFDIVEIPADHFERIYGESHYGILNRIGNILPLLSIRLNSKRYISKTEPKEQFSRFRDIRHRY